MIKYIDEYLNQVTDRCRVVFNFHQSEQQEEPGHGQQSDEELKGAPAKPAEIHEEVSAQTDKSWESKKQNWNSWPKRRPPHQKIQDKE